MAIIPNIKALISSMPPKISISLKRLEKCIPGLGLIEGRRRR